MSNDGLEAIPRLRLGSFYVMDQARMFYCLVSCPRCVLLAAHEGDTLKQPPFRRLSSNPAFKSGNPTAIHKDQLRHARCLLMKPFIEPGQPWRKR
jgi:hypothetical protein